MVIKNDFGEVVGGPPLLATYTFFFKNNTSIEAELNVKDINDKEEVRKVLTNINNVKNVISKAFLGDTNACVTIGELQVRMSEVIAVNVHADEIIISKLEKMFEGE